MLKKILIVLAIAKMSLPINAAIIRDSFTGFIGAKETYKLESKLKNQIKVSFITKCDNEECTQKFRVIHFQGTHAFNHNPFGGTSFYAKCDGTPKNMGSFDLNKESKGAFATQAATKLIGGDAFGGGVQYYNLTRQLEEEEYQDLLSCEKLQFRIGSKKIYNMSNIFSKAFKKTDESIYKEMNKPVKQPIRFR